MKINLKNGVYDVLKRIAQIYLPALGTLYFSLAGIWHLPAPEQVVGTIIAIDTFLGVLLGLSSAAYHDADNSKGKFNGSLNVLPKEGGGKIFALDLNGEPEDLLHKQVVTFKVNSNDGS